MSAFNDDILYYKNLIDNSIVNIYKTGPKLLLDPINHILYGGKRFRPILCLLVNKSLNGKENMAIDCSLSIELLHIFSLIHDDIMDDDALRHSRETIHCKWNVPVAILAGDAILGLAFKRLNKVENKIKEFFNSALIAVCEGQALDIEYESLDKISLEEYIKMIDLKTGHMISLCMQLGAITATNDQSIIDEMQSIGSYIGRAFQIQDDLLEITSSANIIGKNLNSDILLNKKTFLTVDAYEKKADKIDSLKKKYKDDDEKMIIKYKELLHDEGIVDNALVYIDKIFNDAENKLKRINLNDSCLNEFINYVKNREC